MFEFLSGVIQWFIHLHWWQMPLAYLAVPVCIHVLRLLCIRYIGIFERGYGYTADDAEGVYIGFLLFWPIAFPVGVFFGVLLLGYLFFFGTTYKATELTEKHGPAQIKLPKLPEKKLPVHHSKEPEKLPRVKG